MGLGPVQGAHRGAFDIRAENVTVVELEQELFDARDRAMVSPRALEAESHDDHRNCGGNLLVPVSGSFLGPSAGSFGGWGLRQLPGA